MRNVSREANGVGVRRTVAGLLLVSGLVALVYEVVWQRQFALLLGSAPVSTAAVLAAYFTGLGVGSWWGGKWAERVTRPLRAYALVEALVGVGALLVVPVSELLAAWVPPGGTAAVAGRVAVTFVAVALPTLGMGATLPLLGQWIDRGERRLGVTAGWLYVANTLGAAVGALLVPWWLLPTLGLSGAVGAGAGVNAMLALTAWWLDRQMPVERATRPAEGTPAVRIAAGDLGLAAGSGAATFALQVQWNRAFAQVHENSMYSFAAIIAVVILALALGAQAARLALRRGVDPRRLFGWGWLLAGVAVAVGPMAFVAATDGLSFLASGNGWQEHAAHLMGLAGVFVLPAMALLGVGLPALMERAGRTGGARGGGVLGRLLAANVAGSVLGALAAGFWLPGWLGLWGGMSALAAVLVAVGGGLAFRRRSWGVAVAIAGAVAVAVIGFGWRDLPRVKLAPGEVLLSLREGPQGVAAVVERPGSRRLKLNNHYGLGGTASRGDERMQAHVPLLLHPAPRRVAFLGLGTGISAGGALFHPVEQVTIVELVPEVIAASREFFAVENRRVLEDGRTRVVADDARHFLRGTQEKFDVIVGDLVVPWRAGEGALFTLEQFELARKSLARGGVFCQWLPLFQLSETETMILLRTFLKVFPRAEIWRGDFSPTQPAIALVGGAEGWRLDAAVVQRRLGEMQIDPANRQLGAPGVFWMQRVGAIDVADLTGGETRLNREDRPWVELLGPKLHGAAQNEEALFVGRKLQTWLDGVQSKSSERGGEFAAGAPEIAMADAGKILGELVLRMADDDHLGVAAAQAELRKSMPAESYRALFP